MAEAWHGPVADGKSLLGEGGRGLLNIPKARATGECEGRHQGQCLTGGKGRNSNPRLEGSGPVQAGGRGHVLFQRWILLIARMKTEEMTRVKYSGGGKKRGERCWSKKCAGNCGKEENVRVRKHRCAVAWRTGRNSDVVAMSPLC